MLHTLSLKMRIRCRDQDPSTRWEWSASSSLVEPSTSAIYFSIFSPQAILWCSYRPQSPGLLWRNGYHGSCLSHRPPSRCLRLLWGRDSAREEWVYSQCRLHCMATALSLLSTRKTHERWVWWRIGTHTWRRWGGGWWSPPRPRLSPCLACSGPHRR